MMTQETVLGEADLVHFLPESPDIAEIRTFVDSASTDEVVARLTRLETRLVDLDARLRLVADVVDGAGL